MPKQFVIVVFIALTLSVATTVSAQSFQRLELRIPFSFVLKGQTLPAGKYIVERTDPGRPNILTLKNVDGGIVRFVLTQRVEKENPSEASSLIFIQRDEKCYLFQVWTAGSMNGSQIPFPDAKETRYPNNKELTLVTLRVQRR